MKFTGLLLMLLVVCPVRSLAQEQNSWGDAFDCAVDWFGGCVLGKAVREKEQGRKEVPPRTMGASALLQGPNNSNLPAPVRNVLENPSPETARAYVVWSREANEKLA